MRNKNRIPKDNKNTRAVLEEFKKENILKDIAIGKILGDGHITPEGNLMIGQSIKQEEYLNHCYSLFSKYTKSGIKLNTNQRNGVKNYSLVFYTKAIFKEYLKLFYKDPVLETLEPSFKEVPSWEHFTVRTENSSPPRREYPPQSGGIEEQQVGYPTPGEGDQTPPWGDGEGEALVLKAKRGRIKVIPENIEELLTQRGLAYWIMDDGTSRGSGLYLCTHSFTYEENSLLSCVLGTKFKLKTNIKGIKQNGVVRWYCLEFPRESMPLLWELVGEYILPSMRYKFKK